MKTRTICTCAKSKHRRAPSPTETCDMHPLLCGACQEPTDAVDRYDRCLRCAEGQVPKRGKDRNFYNPASDKAIENRTRKVLGLDPCPVYLNGPSKLRELERLRGSMVIIASDDFGTTYRDPATGFELTLFTHAEKV